MTEARDLRLRMFAEAGLNERVTLPIPDFDLSSVKRVTIVACGTSYYAGMVAKYWFEQFARVPVDIDVASEFRYREPPMEVVDKVVRDCQIGSEQLTIVLTPTNSLAGMVQIIARVLEAGLHKAHALGFPLNAIVDGAGSAPLAPPAPDMLTAMGRSNDAILFGGTVQLYVRSEDAAAEKLARELNSQASRDYGKPFAAIFKDYGYDFYKVDPMLFAPAVAIVTNLTSGRTFRGGALNDELLMQSFGS